MKIPRLANFFLFLSVLGISTFSAKALVLTNPRIELPIEAGKTGVATFQVGNILAEPVMLNLKVADWEWGEDSTIKIVNPGTTPYTASNWVEVSPAQSVLKPGQAQIARLLVKVPAGTPPGDYTALVDVQELPATPIDPSRLPQGTTQIRYAFSSGVYLYVQVPPLNRGKFEIMGMQFDAETRRLDYSLSNTGNTRLRAQGSLTIENAAGKVVEKIDLQNRLVLRESTYKFTQELPLLAPGNYVGSLRLSPWQDSPTYTGKLEFTVPST